jgi:hypothetical protein
MDNIQPHLPIYCQKRFLAYDFLSINAKMNGLLRERMCEDLLGKFAIAPRHIFLPDRVFLKLLGHGLGALG